MRRLAPAALLLVLLALASAAKAVEPRERLADPALEARARALSRELRCLVCQNESIDDSDADLAHDLRVLLRERIVAGDSDDLALRFLVSRYGDFVLLKPPVEPATYALWFGPPAILALGAVGAVFYLRRGVPQRLDREFGPRVPARGLRQPVLAGKRLSRLPKRSLLVQERKIRGGE